MKLSIDIETFSTESLKTSGVYRYAEDPVAELLLFGYSVDDGPVRVIDVAGGEVIPEDILQAVADDNVIKTAFNANFERIFLSIWLSRNYPDYFKSCGDIEKYLNPASWRCSMVLAAYNGLPLSLEGVGAVLGLDRQKMKEGKDLIRYFCQPCKPTQSNGGRIRNMSSDAPDKWEMFKAYNIRDVEVEMAIQQRLARYPVPESVWNEYVLDQVINDRGIALDMEVVNNAIRFDELSKGELISNMQDITGIDNPNSVAQKKEWLSGQGIEVESLDKKAVSSLLPEVDGEIADVLKLHQQLSKSSVKKYQAMQNAVCSDGRVHGMFQFYGANRSGRWAGRLVQLQNLVRNSMDDLEAARNIVKSGDYEMMELLYENIPDVLSQLVRTAFVPRPGYKFIVADFSSIEARVLAFLAGEQWRIDAFHNGEDIYCRSASEMFHCKVEKHGENGHLRQRGKIAELALGYNGSIGALKAMGALEMGLTEDELQPLVDAWRASSPNIVSFWWDMDRAVKDAVKMRTSTETHGFKIYWKSGMLFIELPSGRHLSYVKPKMGENRFGGESVTYEGIGVAKRWERIESYGGKFVENVTQAVSRDILAYAMNNLKDYRICAHVHDELIIEVPLDVTVGHICEIMGKTPEWIPGLELRADGYESAFYRKD